MSEIHFNPNPTPAAPSDEALSEEQLAKLAQQRTYLQQQAEDIISIANLQSNSSLNCLHKINVMGGTTEKGYKAVESRILTDKDSHGAYHAIAMAQTTPDLPFDVPALLQVILDSGDTNLQLRVLKLFDSQPIAAEPIVRIKNAILASQDATAIEALNAHLAGKHK